MVPWDGWMLWIQNCQHTYLDPILTSHYVPPWTVGDELLAPGFMWSLAIFFPPVPPPPAPLPVFSFPELL